MFVSTVLVSVLLLTAPVRLMLCRDSAGVLPATGDISLSVIEPCLRTRLGAPSPVYLLLSLFIRATRSASRSRSRTSITRWSSLLAFLWSSLCRRKPATPSAAMPSRSVWSFLLFREGLPYTSLSSHDSTELPVLLSLLSLKAARRDGLAAATGTAPAATSSVRIRAAPGDSGALPSSTCLISVSVSWMLRVPPRGWW